MLDRWMLELVTSLADAFGTQLFVVKGVIAILLVCAVAECFFNGRGRLCKQVCRLLA